MKKIFIVLFVSFLGLNVNAQNNGNNDPCGDIISSYNAAVTYATQLDAVFGILHNSVSSLEVNPHSNGQGNGNNPWQSQGAINGNGAQVGFSVMMPANKGFFNIYFDRNNSKWVFQHVQGTFPNYCTKVIAADCTGANIISNTCP